MRAPLRLAALLLAAAQTAALAQAAEPPRWREGQPEVLQGPTAAGASTEAQLADFRRRYAAAGSPRLLLLWGQALDDGQQQGGQISAQTQGFDARRGLYAQQFTLSWQDRSSSPASLLAPLARARYEAALNELLLSAGVRLVDRNLAIRKTTLGLAREGAREAVREATMAETQALGEFTDLLLQVQWLPDPQAPLGWLARLSLLEVASGALLADSLRRPDEPAAAGALSRSRPLAADGQRVWQATERGFESRRLPPDEGLQALADALRLLQRWPAEAPH